MKGIPLTYEIKAIFGETLPADDNGNLPKGDFAVYQKINQKLTEVNINENYSANELMALNFITDLVAKLLIKYEKNVSLNDILEEFVANKFSSNFLNIYKQELSSHYINASEFRANKILRIWFLLFNQAAQKYRCLFSSKKVNNPENIDQLISHLEIDFADKPKFDTHQNLISIIREALQKEDIFLQLQFIRENWTKYIDIDLSELEIIIDSIKEEKQPRFQGPGPIPVHDFTYEEEYEKFSADEDWMSSLVLIAKNIFVWLEQLRRKYERDIYHLEDIPEEELQLFAKRGFSGIWLIGIWQRSFASKRIKELHGDNDALGSAYSLDDYKIADELGGKQSFLRLKEKASQFGIRIGCDMVPNHTGLDSRWMVEHPDWFLQAAQSPFQSYSFSGEDVSGKDEIEVKIEDHYLDHSDAAVVFRMKDKRDGKIRYIYHGNDGTSFPWNDTAQLNYLKAEVREAVVQKIIEIAKDFPIIRFDAAMTLAKKHIQRLWFPRPGEGGAIPSRARYSLSNADFQKLIPTEFWREVVDRVKEEAPDTLLLAEAFWMMEGFFVRTLGMHRVYNSAFMHMLMNEDNAKYRQSIYNVLDFNPEILKRFVNFMSNPDEETAIFQFGKDDKYFGCCILMCTLPGLPMFAHGQIEGFTEKYGMEYHKPKWYEHENEELVNRHRAEIFPLLHKRKLFADVQNFHMYDFTDEYSNINEDVFAFSNQKDNQFGLVIFNNKYAHTKGRIIRNKIFSDKQNNHFAQIFNLHNQDDYYLLFKDNISNHQYIRKSAEIFSQGFGQELGAYKYVVYTDFNEIRDDEKQTYKKLFEYLQENESNDIEKSLRRIEYADLVESFDSFLDVYTIRTFLTFEDSAEFHQFVPELKKRINNFLLNCRSVVDFQKPNCLIKNLLQELDNYYSKKNKLNKEDVTLIVIYIFIKNLFRCKNFHKFEVDWFKEVFFDEKLSAIFASWLFDVESELTTDLLLNLIHFDYFYKSTKSLDFLPKIFELKSFRKYLQVNIFDEIAWFNKERFEILFSKYDLMAQVLFESADYDIWQKYYQMIKKSKKSSDYMVEKFLKNIHGECNGKNGF